MNKKEITRDQVILFLHAALCNRLGCSHEELDNDTNLLAHGLKSIDAVLISGELEDNFGITLDPILLMDNRTINEAASQIMSAYSHS